VPCLVPVWLPSADDADLHGIVSVGAAELAGAGAVTVPQRLDDGSLTLWLYWNAPADGDDGRWGSQMQLVSNQRVMAR